MALRVLCPNGHELIAEDGHLGRKIRCPACKVVMILPAPNPPPAPAPPPAPPPAVQKEPPAAPSQPAPQPPGPLVLIPGGPPDDYFDDDRPRKGGMKTRPRMRLANLGLGFHYAKVLCMLVATLSILGAFVIAPLVQSPGLFLLLFRLALILMILTPVLGGTGSLLCFWLPEKSRSRVLVIITFGLEVGGTVAWILVLVLTTAALAAGGMMGEGALTLGKVGLVLLVLASAVIYASFLMFLLVLRALANYLRDRASAEEALRQLIIYVIVTLGGTVLVMVLGFLLPRLGEVGLYLLGMITLGLFVAYALVLFAILKVIATVRQGIATRW